MGTIELEPLPLCCTTSKLDIRQKIYKVMRAFSVDELSATKLATACSEICLRVDEPGKSATISIRVETGERPGLLFVFRPTDVDIPEAILRPFFDEVTEKADGERHAFHRQRNPFPPLTSSFLEEQQAQLKRLSRAELLRELQEKNEALQRHRDELEQRVEQRTTELRLAMFEAQQASHSKSLFLANMSHELRTPLNAIIGYSEILSEELAENNVEYLRVDVEKIDRAAWHLLAIINDVLELSALASGHIELHPEPFELKPFLDELCLSIDKEMKKNENQLITKHGDLPVLFYTDRGKTRRCLLNILSNAAKFTRQGTVTFAAQCLPQTEEYAISFQITDTGVGIAPEKVETLFEDFMQVDASFTRQFGGLGLGLSLTQRLCRLLGGSIEVKSQPGIGSTFTIYLPERPPEQMS